MTTLAAVDLDPHLARGYKECAEITRRHGTTYFWGAAILPTAQRRHVHAVYSLCRRADDLVDAVGATTADRVEATTAALAGFAADFRAAVAEGGSDDAMLAAAARTVTETGIDPECFDRFFSAMAQDLHTHAYATWDDLLGYMEGSAAVIGEMMLPVLRPTDAAAREPARALGLAFQLTNFLRDVDEDLGRGRVYVPQEDLDRFGVDLAGRRVDPAWRELMRFEIARNRGLYRRAEEGLRYLPPASERCVRTAKVLYAGILERIEAADYDVFTSRARVPTWRKAAVAATALGAVAAARTTSTGATGATGAAAATGATPATIDPSRPPRVPLALRPMPRRTELTPTWAEAKPARIRRSLDAALARDPGGWYVVGASGDLGSRSLVRTVGGHEVALWRTGPGPREIAAGPGSCPHLGALLGDCEVMGRDLVCRWHGLAMPPEGRPGWSTYAAHDDGVLLWVRIPTQGETSADLPTITARPDAASSVAAVVEVVGTCEPRDIVANRLDPWHGSWFHPYAFSHLTVDEAATTDDVLSVDVTFRVSRTWGVPVRAEFACPDARTIVMTIVEGEGAGSVVETHATPLGLGPDGKPRTMMVEATVATSERAGFAVARRLAPLLRPAMRHTARRLWVDDLTYAERSYLLRSRGESYGV